MKKRTRQETEVVPSREKVGEETIRNMGTPGEIATKPKAVEEKRHSKK